MYEQGRKFVDWIDLVTTLTQVVCDGWVGMGDLVMYSELDGIRVSRIYFGMC